MDMSLTHMLTRYFKNYIYVFLFGAKLESSMLYPFGLDLPINSFGKVEAISVEDQKTSFHRTILYPTKSWRHTKSSNTQSEGFKKRQYYIASRNH